MQVSTTEDIQTIVKGSYAIDQIRKDVKTFLMILRDQNVPIGWDNTIDLGTIGEGNWCNNLKVTFAYGQNSRQAVFIDFKAVGCETSRYELPGETLPAHVAVDLYQLLPKLFDAANHNGILELNLWGIPLYRKALSLV